MLSSLHLNGHIVMIVDFFFRNKELSIGLSKILGRKILIFYEEKPSTQFMLHTYDLSYALLISVNLVLQKRGLARQHRRTTSSKGNTRTKKTFTQSRPFSKLNQQQRRARQGNQARINGCSFFRVDFAHEKWSRDLQELTEAWLLELKRRGASLDKIVFFPALRQRGKLSFIFDWFWMSTLWMAL